MRDRFRLPRTGARFGNRGDRQQHRQDQKAECLRDAAAARAGSLRLEQRHVPLSCSLESLRSARCDHLAAECALVWAGLSPFRGDERAFRNADGLAWLDSAGPRSRSLGRSCAQAGRIMRKLLGSCTSARVRERMRPRGVSQRFPQRPRSAALLYQIRERLLGKVVDRPLCLPRQGLEGVPRLRSEVDASRHTNTIPRLWRGCEDYGAITKRRRRPNRSSCAASNAHATAKGAAGDAEGVLISSQANRRSAEGARDDVQRTEEMTDRHRSAGCRRNVSRFRRRPRAAAHRHQSRWRHQSPLWSQDGGRKDGAGVAHRRRRRGRLPEA